MNLDEIEVTYEYEVDEINTIVSKIFELMNNDFLDIDDVIDSRHFTRGMTERDLKNDIPF